MVLWRYLRLQIPTMNQNSKKENVAYYLFPYMARIWINYLRDRSLAFANEKRLQGVLRELQVLNVTTDTKRRQDHGLKW